MTPAAGAAGVFCRGDGEAMRLRVGQRISAGRAFLALASLSIAGPAAAQDWFTRDACTIAMARIDPSAYPPGLQDDYRKALAAIPNPYGRLWRIMAPGGGVSHLWGTYHTPHPLLLDLPDAFRAVLKEARVVALEFDPLPESRAELNSAFDTATLWNPWSSVPQARDDIDPRVMGWILQRMTDIDWDASYLSQMTDAGLFSLILFDPCGDYLSGVLPGQDLYIAQEAYLAGAEVTGLQQPQDLALQLTDPSRAANARALIQLYGAALGPDGADPAIRSTAYALYLQGRLGELDLWSSDLLERVYLPDEAERIESLAKDYVLVERNGFFVSAARPLLDQGGAVLAVGAGHLPGELGMVEMLRDAGYLVERVPLPDEPP
jgi:uncharacterized protein